MGRDSFPEQSYRLKVFFIERSFLKQDEAFPLLLNFRACDSAAKEE